MANKSTPNWVPMPNSGPLEIESIDGIMWYVAVRPHRWHRCKPQTRGLKGSKFAERCACGAIRLSNWGSWINRNSRRSEAKKKEKS